MNFLFDFDSTLIKSESLNDVLNLALGNNKEKILEVEKITKMAMEGLISPQDSMSQRLKLATINKELVNKISEKTKNETTDGIKDLIFELKKYNNVNIFIISGGFKEMIIPTAKILEIPEKNIYANEFIYNKNNIVEKAKDNVILQEQGKVKMINKLKNEGILIGKNTMVGDGFTDLETILYNAVDNYICFCGVIERESVKNKSKMIAKSTSELKDICLKIINGSLNTN